MISIVSYGVGNLSSIANMFRALGIASEFADTPARILAARKLLLPGVGAFDHGMDRLENAGLIEALNEAALSKRTPTLGICLGMQLMCRASEEGRRPGLGWIDAEVRRFRIPPEKPDLKVPHMGWNTLKLLQDSALIRQEQGTQRFYFVHSFHVECKDASDVVATAAHGQDFVAAFNRQNLYGVQFHPEKSHRFGMALMKRFGDL